MIRTGTGKANFDKVRADLNGLQRMLVAASQANQRRSGASQRALRDVLIIGLVVTIALLVALAMLLTRWVTRPTAGLVDRVGVVAGGDFRAELDVDGPPEFSAISAAVDSMRQRILSELDQLERYNEALDQTGPVIQLLRTELEAGDFSPPSGVEVAGRVLAAEGLLAGDFYDLVPMADGRFAMLVADVSGHGHKAGVLAIRFKFLVEAALHLGDEPSASLAWAAERLGDTGDMFVTCALAVIDPTARTIAFASAGHSPGLILVGPQGEVTPLISTGPLIGPFAGDWRTEHHALADATTTLALCSDGLLEARASADELFGFDRFIEIVRRCESVDQIVDECCTAARDHAGERLSDDLTIVAIRLLAPAPMADA
jgi:serine phosphatase RsbU (regulator of sigma subunit)